MSEGIGQNPVHPSAASGRRASGERLLAAQRQLREQVGRAGESSESILQSLRQIAGAANEAVERSARGLTGCRELESSVKRAGRRGEGVEQRTVDFQQALRRTLAELQSLVEGVQGLLGKNQRIFENAKTLGSLTAEIDQKVGGVVGSSEQITLLALNAVIAANRAGRFGRAFSVVANEVQTLAERSAVSAEEIRSLASSIQGEVKGVLDSIEEIRGYSEDEISRSEQLVRGLRDAGEEAASVHEECQKIQALVQETESFVDGMRRSAERISSSSEEFARRIRKALAASETQKECFGTIEISLEAFREAAKALVAGGSDEDVDAAVGQMTLAVEGLAEMVGGIEQATREAIGGIHEIAEVATREVEQVRLSAQEKKRAAKPVEAFREAASRLRGKMAGLEERIEREVLAGLDTFSQRSEQSSERIRMALARIFGLRTQTRRIQKIAWEISLVIQETNVMAFNGSVEAVRAGQFGRSFAQVADDVRDLSRESIQAADRIQDVVGEIQEQLSAMLRMLEEAEEKSKRVAESARGTLQNLQIARHQFRGLEEEMRALEETGAGLEESLRAAGGGIDAMVASLDIVAKSAVSSRTEARERSRDIEILDEKIAEMRALGSAIAARSGGSG